MSSRRRITAALIGLLLLVVVGWAVRGLVTGHSTESMPEVPTSVVRDIPAGGEGDRG